jgi:ferredoxin
MEDLEAKVYKVDSAKCTGCGTCVDVCPSSAISMVDGVAVINPDDCVECGSCASECPSEAIFEE